MKDLLEAIRQADALQLNDLLHAVLKRYETLYPDWEVCTFSVEKGSDRSEQLDRMIQVPESMKNL